LYLYWTFKTEPKDDDVTRHIIELREKLGWQTVLWQHNLKYNSPEVAAWKVLKVLLYFVQFWTTKMNT
jgi:hypothetical protein